MAKLLSSTVLLFACACASQAYNGARYQTPESLLLEAFAQVTLAVPGPGIRSIDPVYISSIEGNFATMHYTKNNNTVRGLSNCKITKNVFSSDRRVVYFVLDCPNVVMTSSIDIQGYVLYESMYGHGSLEIDYGRYVISVYAQVSYVKDYYGNVYYKIGSFSLDISLNSPTKYNFKNLYNNNKNRSAAISKFASDNWAACAIYSKEPV